jgi:membrane-associated phospholipid phosphatase
MARRLLLAVTAYVVLVLVVIGWGWLLTHPLEGSVGAADNDVSRWFAAHRTDALDPVAKVGTLLGETWFGLVVSAVVAVASWLLDRSLRGPVLVLLADAGAGGIYWLASHAIPRDRPPVEILDPGLVPTHSFPSGHVGTAVSVYGAAALLLALHLSSTPLRRAAVAFLLALPAYVLLSRLYEGAHHLTDVATSVVYATTWLAVLAATLRPAALYPQPVTRSERGLRDTPVPHR